MIVENHLNADDEIARFRIDNGVTDDLLVARVIVANANPAAT